MDPPRTTFGRLLRDYRQCWKPLLVTDILCKVIAFVLLTPLVGMLFRLLLAYSGPAVRSDLDILYFLLGPAGWTCLVVVGGLALGIAVLEQAALLRIVATRGRLGSLDALRFVLLWAWPVIRATSRCAAMTALVVAPFLVVAAVVYFMLLTEYDINFYLRERPPAFLVAVGLGGLIGTGLAALLLYLFVAWLFALPMILFENATPRTALRECRKRVRGRRLVVLFWLVGWSLATALLSAAVTALVVAVARLLVPLATASLAVAAVAIAGTLLVWCSATLAANLFSTTVLATLLFNLYAGNDQETLPDMLPANIGGQQWLTRRRVALIACAGVVLTLGVSVAMVRSIRLQDKTTVTAHRGSSQAAPENTLAAIQQAIADQADWVEIDVQETADGEVVVFHDSDFMKLAGKNLKIWDATLADLKDIDIGSWFQPSYQKERVPTLGAVLDACKGKIRVNIELKYYGHDQKLEQRVAELVDARGMAADIVVMSLKPAGVKKMKALRPSWKVGLLLSVYRGNVRDFEADFLAVNAAFVSRDFIRTAHRHGKEVHVWTVNDAVTMSNMIGMGVDSLITDKPGLGRAVLQQRAQLSSPERLLLNLAGVLGVKAEIGGQ